MRLQTSCWETVYQVRKLTTTWARRYEDCPFAEDYSYLNGNLDIEEYKEGILSDTVILTALAKIATVSCLDSNVLYRV